MVSPSLLNGAVALVVCRLIHDFAMCPSLPRFGMRWGEKVNLVSRQSSMTTVTYTSAPMSAAATTLPMMLHTTTRRRDDGRDTA